MRKIIAGLFISLDGVVEAPDQWQFPYFNDEMGAAVDATLGAADTILFGRKTYDATVAQVQSPMPPRLVGTLNTHCSAATRPPAVTAGHIRACAHAVERGHPRCACSCCPYGGGRSTQNRRDSSKCSTHLIIDAPGHLAWWTAGPGARVEPLRVSL